METPGPPDTPRRLADIRSLLGVFLESSPSECPRSVSRSPSVPGVFSKAVRRSLQGVSGQPRVSESLGVVPSLQGVFLGGSLRRVSRESPGPPGVSVESPGVPECPGSVSGGTPESPPSLRGVSGQKRTLPGVSERSPSLPGVFSAQGLRSSFILGKLLRSR